MNEEREKEFCSKRDDETHCDCWYDGNNCCACGSPAMECCCVIGAFSKPTLVTVNSWRECPVHGEVIHAR